MADPGGRGFSLDRRHFLKLSGVATPGLMNPLHFAGSEGHLGCRFPAFEPGTHAQSTRLEIRSWRPRMASHTASVEG